MGTKFYSGKKILKETSDVNINKSACRMCHGGCGVIIYVKNMKVVNIEGDPESPLNRGKICIKGRSSIQHLYNPHRLKYPLKRKGSRGEGKWQRISWDEALDETVKNIKEIKDKYGVESIVVGQGTGRHHFHHVVRSTDFKKETIDAYDKLNQLYKESKVIETYGNIIRENKIGSGRVANQLPDVDLLDLKLFIEYSKKKNIGFNYTINAITMRNKEFTPEGVREIKRFLKDLNDAGVRSLTVALPSFDKFTRMIHSADLEAKQDHSSMDMDVDFELN